MRIIPQNVAEMIAVGLLPYPVKSIEEHGDGLINCTFKIVTKSPDHPNFLLQKINNRVFKDIEGLQSNIRQITDHIRKKLETEGVEDIDRRVLTPACIQCNGDCKAYYWDHNGDYWRMYIFIEDTVSYEKMQTPLMAEKAGVAFGKFQKQLIDFNPVNFCEVLPDFHNTPKRVESLKKRIEENPAGRLKEVKKEVDLLLEREGTYSKIVELGQAGKLPKRFIHQDTKFNNVLLDKNEDILCVIDLDTVMQGYICYDVGDAIRGGANKGREDDEDLNAVEVDMDIFRGFVKGYISQTIDFLTCTEMESIAFGPRLLAYEQAVRFLDDYLNGDKYYKYKTGYPQHNLVRARAQIKLMESMEQRYAEMSEYVRECAKWKIL